MADATRDITTVKGPAKKGPSRRAMLIGGGAGLGLVITWALWPRTYLPNLSPGPGESVFNAWIKIGRDGRLTVAVPQTETGQGVFTALPQIVAEELGADWTNVGVETAPLNPLYANPLAARTLFEPAFGNLPEAMTESHAARAQLILTGGSTSVRMFEEPLRRAGAAARVLLCKAAAARWGVDWRSCGTANGFVVSDNRRLPFGELAEDAIGYSLPDPVPLRGSDRDGWSDRRIPRLDAPGKVDGSATFAGDIRLPGMVFASIRQAPIGGRLIRWDEAAANRLLGMRVVAHGADWIAAIANNWWTAERALEEMRPFFRVEGRRVTDASIAAALTAALDGDGYRVAATGDLSKSFRGQRVVSAEYRVAMAPHIPMETMTATAAYADGRLSLWMPTQAPAIARAAAARAIGIGEGNVAIHPMMAGGSFGAKLEYRVAEQAAILSKQIGRPVQLTWSRAEDLRQDRFRAPAAARMTARLAQGGGIDGWLAKIAVQPTGRELAGRMLGKDPVASAAMGLPSTRDASAVVGAQPPYAIANMAVDHHPADTGVPTGYWHSDAHSYTCFFTESFLDELAHVAGIEAHEFRMSLLSEAPRLARCLTTAAQLGGWQGGTPGSNQGLACHSFRGSHIGLLAEARVDGGRVVVDRMVAAVDCGRVINADLVRQQIESGLLFGMAAATGTPMGWADNYPDVTRMGQLGLPRLADSPEIVVELIPGESDAGGVSELAVPVAAPAIANALQAATGRRFRTLPFHVDG